MTSTLMLAKHTGLILDGAKRGGVAGVVLGPISTTVNASINGDPILDTNGVLGLDNDFATNALLDTSKGALSGAAGGAAGVMAAAWVGAGAGSVVPGLGTAVGFVVGIGGGALVSWGAEEYGYKHLRPE